MKDFRVRGYSHHGICISHGANVDEITIMHFPGTNANDKKEVYEHFTVRFSNDISR